MAFSSLLFSNSACILSDMLGNFYMFLSPSWSTKAKSCSPVSCSFSWETTALGFLWIVPLFPTTLLQVSFLHSLACFGKTKMVFWIMPFPKGFLLSTLGIKPQTLFVACVVLCNLATPVIFLCNGPIPFFLFFANPGIWQALGVGWSLLCCKHFSNWDISPLYMAVIDVHEIGDTPDQVPNQA